MKTTTSRPPRDWREGRRLRAWELHQQGWPGKQIAAALGVTQGAVSQWLTRARAGGVAALHAQPPPGPTPRLTDAQRTELVALLQQGAEAHGFLGQVWTTKRVAAVIQTAFGVHYHPAHVSRLLRTLPWTVQKPRRRASQRDEAAIAAWTTEQIPALEKKRRTKIARSCG
jgi:transposase